MTHGKQKKIANDVGVTPKFLGDILTCRRKPSRKTAIRLELATGIPAADWIFKTGPELRALLDERFSG